MPDPRGDRLHARIGVSTAAACLVLGVQITFALPAQADDAVILVADSNKVTLADQDGGATASVTLENQGAKDVEVSVTPGSGAEDDCDIAPPDDATVKAHRQQKMTFTFSEACDPDEGTNFTVTTGQRTAAEATFNLHADPPTKPDPNWIVVGLIYVFAALISVVVLAVAWCRWKVPDKLRTSGTFGWRCPPWTPTGSLRTRGCERDRSHGSLHRDLRREGGDDRAAG